MSARARADRRRAGDRLAPARATGRLARRSVALLCGTALLAVSACGSGHAARSTRGGSATSASAGSPVKLHLASIRMLPAPVQLPAVSAAGGAVLAVGGLDAGEASTAEILRIDQSGARSTGQLPVALHDGAAASIEEQAYYFGGGGASGASAAIYRVGPAGATLAGQLPVGASDVGAAGYTEVVPLSTIVAFTPGSGVRVAGMLPLPLRYAAVAAVGGHVLVAGGTSGSTAQRAILSFDPTTGAVHQIGQLPYPLTHAAGASLDGRLLIFGGRGGELSSQRAEILSIDPATGTISYAGSLPQPLSDMGAASLGGELLLIGGRDRAGTVHDQVLSYLAAR